MSGFDLSPGITPALVGAFSVELPIAFGLSYVFFPRRGMAIAIATNACALGVIKIYTDFTDSFDVVLAAAVLLCGLAAFGTVAVGALGSSRGLRSALLVLAVYAVPLGAIKIVSDFYDPFDIFVATLGIIAGALLLHWILDGQSEGTRGRMPVVLFGLLSVMAIFALLVLLWMGFGWPWLFIASFVPVTLSAVRFSG